MGAGRHMKVLACAEVAVDAALREARRIVPGDEAYHLGRAIQDVRVAVRVHNAQERVSSTEYNAAVKAAQKMLEAI